MVSTIKISNNLGIYYTCRLQDKEACLSMGFTSRELSLSSKARLPKHFLLATLLPKKYLCEPRYLHIENKHTSETFISNHKNFIWNPYNLLRWKQICILVRWWGGYAWLLLHKELHMGQIFDRARRRASLAFF